VESDDVRGTMYVPLRRRAGNCVKTRWKARPLKRRAQLRLRLGVLVVFDLMTK